MAFLLAKLYFFLGEYNEALDFALDSGSQFDIKKPNDEFTTILANKCIEKYIENLREKKTDDPNHEKYKKIVDFMIENSLKTGDFKLPLGLSLDS